jgi:hypothetical protein
VAVGARQLELEPAFGLGDFDGGHERSPCGQTRARRPRSGGADGSGKG